MVASLGIKPCSNHPNVPGLVRQAIFDPLENPSLHARIPCLNIGYEVGNSFSLTGNKP